MNRHCYGVLKAHAIRYIHGFGQQPHFHIHLQDDRNLNYRASINIQSKSYPSELIYSINSCDPHEAEALKQLPSGLTSIQQNLPLHGLDFIRRPLCDKTDMIPMPASLPGPDNDLNEKIVALIDGAISANAELYVFGDSWGPENETKDYYFGFLPGRGLHNIHMNQGNHEAWQRDNGTFRDGGILIHFAKEDRWVGLFLAFQSQSWITDELGQAAD